MFEDEWYDRIFADIEDTNENWFDFEKAVENVLGISTREYGIANYRFEQIDVEIFGGTYERFLAEQRQDKRA